MLKPSTFRRHSTLNGVRIFRNHVGFYECKLGIFSSFQTLIEAILKHNEEVKIENLKTMTLIESIKTAPVYFTWDGKFFKKCENVFIEVSSFGYDYENDGFNQRAYSINSYSISSLLNFTHEWVKPISEEEFNEELNKAYQDIVNTK